MADEIANAFFAQTKKNIVVTDGCARRRSYTKGKFTADRKFDANAVSKQCGAAVLLLSMSDAKIIELDRS